MNSRLRRAVAPIGVLLVAAACSSDSDNNVHDLLVADSPVVDQGIGGEGIGPGTLSIEVVLVEGRPAGYPRTWEVDTSSEKPGAGATVAVDLPNGQRVEKTADASGKVELSDVDWSSGTAAVTAYVKGHQLTTLFGIRQADGPQTLYLLGPKPPQTAKVTVTPKNAAAGVNWFGAFASSQGWSCEGAVGAKALDVEQGKPFTVLGLHGTWPSAMTRELLVQNMAWAKVDQPGVTQPTSIDVDFASKLTPTQIKGTILLPTTGLVGTASRPRFWTRQRGNSIGLGLPTKTTMKSASEFTYDAEVVKLVDETGVYTDYYAEVGEDWYGSYITVEGYPKDGATVGPNFVPVPELQAPASFTTPAKWSSTIRWKAVADVVPVVEISKIAALPCLAIGSPVATGLPWVLVGTKGASELTLPQPPSTVTASDMPEIFSGAQARVCFAADLDDKTRSWPSWAGGPTRSWSRWANGRTFKLEAP